MSLKALFQRTLRHVGLHLVRDRHPGARYLDLVPVTPLDFLFHWLFPDPRGLRILQIGAHDGVRNDPLYRWIMAYRWSGYLVEPMPDFAARLRQLHALSPQIEIVEAAVGEVPGHTTLYRIDPSLPNLPAWSAGLATLDPQRAQTAVRDLGLTSAQLVTQSVSVITMSDLLARYRSAEPDVVAIDTEGFDLKPPPRYSKPAAFRASCILNTPVPLPLNAGTSCNVSMCSATKPFPSAATPPRFAPCTELPTPRFRLC